MASIFNYCAMLYQTFKEFITYHKGDQLLLCDSVILYKNKKIARVLQMKKNNIPSKFQCNPFQLQCNTSLLRKGLYCNKVTTKNNNTLENLIVLDFYSRLPIRKIRI